MANFFQQGDFPAWVVLVSSISILGCGANTATPSSDTKGSASSTGPSAPLGRCARTAVDEAAQYSQAARPPWEQRPGEMVEGEVWRPSSAKIEINAGGYWQGAAGYAAERNVLTPEQLVALGNLCAMKADPNAPAVADATQYTVVVTDTDGSTQRFIAAEGNLFESSSNVSRLAWHTLKAILATYQCVSSWEPPTSEELAAGAMKAIPNVPADLSCVNRVGFRQNCETRVMKLSVPFTKTYRFEMKECAEPLGVRVVASGTNVPIAQSNTTATCPTVTTQLDPGDYTILMDRKVPGCGTTMITEAQFRMTTVP
jgi:hypothetical protein